MLTSHLEYNHMPKRRHHGLITYVKADVYTQLTRSIVKYDIKFVSRTGLPTYVT